VFVEAETPPHPNPTDDPTFDNVRSYLDNEFPPFLVLVALRSEGSARMR
jgi:hypothetical protein